MNYCSQDGWLGSETYLRGSIIFKGIFSQVLKDQDPETTELVVVGSSAGTIGVFNHIEWIVNSLHYPAGNIQMILDSFYAPVTQVTPMEVTLSSLASFFLSLYQPHYPSESPRRPPIHYQLHHTEHDLLGRWISLCCRV
jgi:hypothetical protein